MPGRNDPLCRMVIFADSTQLAEDESALHQNGGRGIRYHRAGAQEEQDAIQALDATRVLQNAVTTLASYDYKSKAIVSTEVPTHHRYGGEHAPVLESYDYAGPYAFANRAEAERYARLHRETLDPNVPRKVVWQLPAERVYYLDQMSPQCQRGVQGRDWCT